jgi:hypothetical protein
METRGWAGFRGIDVNLNKKFTPSGIMQRL